MQYFKIKGHPIAVFHVDMSREDVEATISANDKKERATVLPVVGRDRKVFVTHASKEGIVDDLYNIIKNYNEGDLIVACHPKKCQEHYEGMGYPLAFAFLEKECEIWTAYVAGEDGTSYLAVHPGRPFTIYERKSLVASLK